MAFPRPSHLRSVQSLGRVASRRAGTQARANTFRNIGRRTYASGHEAKQSSDLPWMIGAVVFTVPAATWLIGQAPEKTPHGHGEHDEKHEEGGKEESKQEDEPKEASETESKDESKDETKEKDDDQSKDDAESDSKDDSKDESKDDDKETSNDDDSKDDSKTSNDEEYEGPSSGKKAQYFRNPDKKPGEGQKGDRAPSETKGEKDEHSNYSGAKHPNLEDPSKSRKSAGLTDTAKIHGTAKPTYANPGEPSSPVTPSEKEDRA